MAANALYGVTDLSCICRGWETTALAVDRLLGDSFATPNVSCDCLKVGLDFVSTDRLSGSRMTLWASERMV